MNEANVVFKGTRNGIEVLFDAFAPFEALKQELQNKLQKNARFFGGGADVQVSAVVGRSLEDEEQKVLLNIFGEYFNEDGIRFLQHKPPHDIAAHRRTKGNVVNAMERANAVALRTEEDKSLFVYSTLRNGQRLHSEGNIIVMGDVNPGAQLAAGGNIVVLGAMRGVAHAGALGNTDAVVFALNLQPTQLRIADMIAIAPPKAQKTGYPELAHVQQGTITIEPYDPGAAAQLYAAL